MVLEHFHTVKMFKRPMLAIIYYFVNMTATKYITDLVQSEVARLMTFGTGDNIERAANHVVTPTDETAYEVII